MKEIVQEDGRIRMWGNAPEFEGKCLRVILLDDRETVLNAFLTGGLSHESQIF